VLCTRCDTIPLRPLLRGSGRFFMVVGVAASFGTADDVLGQTSIPSSQAAARDIRAFQPGVGIDWASRAVYVDGRVVLRAGLLEFLACFAGKEHESIVRLEASATHIYTALGLVGLEPGHPPRWDEQRGRFGPPTGDLVDVSIEWEIDGDRRSAAGFQWLRECEYERTPIDRPWVFAGSRRLGDGTLSADHSGEGIAVVDQPNSLLALSRNHVSHDAELWAEANTAAIPPVNTRVRVVLQPARARAYEVRVDFRGAAFADGRFVPPEDLADLIKLARHVSADYVQPIRLEGTLRSDAAALRGALLRAGVSPEGFRFIWRCSDESTIRALSP
jgi:hypothetical protein